MPVAVEFEMALAVIAAAFTWVAPKAALAVFVVAVKAPFVAASPEVLA